MVSLPTLNFKTRTFQITQFINLSQLNHPTRIGLAIVPFRKDPVKIPFILGIYLLTYPENIIICYPTELVAIYTLLCWCLRVGQLHRWGLSVGDCVLVTTCW